MTEEARLGIMMLTMVVATAAFTGTFWGHVGDSQKHQTIPQKQIQIDSAISDSEHEWNRRHAELAVSLQRLTESVRAIRDEQVRNTTKVDELWEAK
jgi:hypothetical protein